MFELTRSIITDPVSALLCVIILWGILHLTFVKFLNLKPTTWARLEYVWIAVGLLGALTLIDENRRQFKVNELGTVNVWIENDYKSLIDFISSDFRCLTFSNTGIFSNEEFNIKQARADTICSWTKSVKSIVDSLYSNGKLEIESLPPLNVENANQDYVFERITTDVRGINQNIKLRSSLTKEINDKFWLDFKYTLGILLLVLAFGLRLTIVSYKVRKEKNKA